MAVADRSGLPIAIYTASASPHEVRLVGETLGEVFTDELPARLIGDKAYDSDPLDAELTEQGVEMIAPHKRNRRKANTQDGHACAATNGVGKLSVFSPGCISFVESSFVMIITPRIILALSN